MYGREHAHVNISHKRNASALIIHFYTMSACAARFLIDHVAWKSMIPLYDCRAHGAHFQHHFRGHPLSGP